MKKIIISCLLATSAASAFAEWMQVNNGVDSNSYIDFETIRNDGNLRKFWYVQDLKQRHADGEMSRRVRYEIDCKNERSKILSFSTHSERMAGGRVLQGPTIGSGQLDDIAPDTVAEIILKIVCDK